MYERSHESGTEANYDMVDGQVNNQKKATEKEKMYIPTRQSTLHGVLVHGFRRYSARFPKAEQYFDLLDYERSYLKNCVNGAFMPSRALPLTQISRYETHIIVVLCSPE